MSPTYLVSVFKNQLNPIFHSILILCIYLNQTKFLQLGQLALASAAFSWRPSLIYLFKILGGVVAVETLIVCNKV